VHVVASRMLAPLEQLILGGRQQRTIDEVIEEASVRVIAVEVEINIIRSVHPARGANYEIPPQREGRIRSTLDTALQPPAATMGPGNAGVRLDESPEFSSTGRRRRWARRLRGRKSKQRQRRDHTKSS
jgi:hypothetical protein